MDIFDELGELAIAARMKRLYDQIMLQGQEIYQLYNIDFDPNNFIAFYVIAQQPNISVTELADKLGFSHPAIINQVKALDKRGLVCSQQGQQDKRKRLICLSEKGEALLPQLEIAWKDIATTLHQIMQNQKHSLLASILETESDLKQQSFKQRVQKVKNQRQLSEVQIVDFAQVTKNYFKGLNLEWIEKYFVVEAEDAKVLSTPKKHLIDKGGNIIYALYQGEVVGTCGLKKWSNDEYELVKMAVSPKAQGKQIGKKLGQAIIELAQEKGCKRLFLESNRKLVPAINLYRRLGFQEVAHTGSCSQYERCDITMEILF